MTKCEFSGRAVRGRGTSLIEVLIALTLVAVTMLGLLGLQLRSMGMQKDSLDRRTATMIVAGFAERIAANYAGYEANGYFNLAGATQTVAQSLLNAPLPCTTASNCLPAEVAQRDWVQFQDQVSQRLPDGVAFSDVPKDSSGAAIPNSGGVQVTVAWRDLQRPTTLVAGAAQYDPACLVLPDGTPAKTDPQYRCYSAFVYP